MARMRWDKNEQARRAARYGTAPMERELASGGTKVQKKKRKRKANKQKLGNAPRHKHYFRVPETDDPARRVRNRLREFETQLSQVKREIRSAQATLNRKRSEAGKLESRIERLERILASPDHPPDRNS